MDKLSRSVCVQLLIIVLSVAGGMNFIRFISCSDINDKLLFGCSSLIILFCLVILLLDSLTKIADSNLKEFTKPLISLCYCYVACNVTRKKFLDDTEGESEEKINNTDDYLCNNLEEIESLIKKHVNNKKIVDDLINELDKYDCLEEIDEKSIEEILSRR